MSFTETSYEHIAIDENGAPIIAGTTMKVIELVVEKTAYGWSPEEIQFQHPYLTLGQIYSALAYHADHPDELDRDIERRLQGIAQLQQAARPSSLAARLKSKGLL